MNYRNVPIFMEERRYGLVVAKSNLRAYLGVAGGREARAVCCQTGDIVRDSASDILYGLTHIGMSGSRLYN